MRGADRVRRPAGGPGRSLVPLGPRQPRLRARRRSVRGRSLPRGRAARPPGPARPPRSAPGAAPVGAAGPRGALRAVEAAHLRPVAARFHVAPAAAAVLARVEEEPATVAGRALAHPLELRADQQLGRQPHQRPERRVQADGRVGPAPGQRGVVPVCGLAHGRARERDKVLVSAEVLALGGRGPADRVDEVEAGQPARQVELVLLILHPNCYYDNRRLNRQLGGSVSVPVSTSTVAPPTSTWLARPPSARSRMWTKLWRPIFVP